MIGIIMGPQGSGKGTQAEFICRDFGFKHCSMGDLLKDEASKGTPEGKIITKLQLEGKLVPEEITNKIASKAIKQNKSVLFDGYPRNEVQANFLFEKGYKPNFVILIEVSEKETVKRLEKRRICTATKKIYRSDELTKKDIEECRAAGGEIIQRDDDKPEAIKQRLKIYEAQTAPLLDMFRKKSIPVIKIDGEQPVEKVYEKIKKSLSGVIKK